MIAVFLVSIRVRKIKSHCQEARCKDFKTQQLQFEEPQRRLEILIFSKFQRISVFETSLLFLRTEKLIFRLRKFLSCESKQLSLLFPKTENTFFFSDYNHPKSWIILELFQKISRLYFVFVLSTSVLEKTHNFFKSKNTLLTTRFGGKKTQKNQSEMLCCQCDFGF